MDAVAFVLVHEATHIVDAVLGLTSPKSGQQVEPAPFARGVWASAARPTSAYRETLLDSARLRIPGGTPHDIEQAPALYEELRRTPFASVYASLMVVQDIAELVAWRQMTEKYGQPYRIEVRRDEEIVYVYEPMRPSLVRSRLDQPRRFDSPTK